MLWGSRRGAMAARKMGNHRAPRVMAPKIFHHFERTLIHQSSFQS